MAGALSIGQAGRAHPSPGHMTRAEFNAILAERQGRLQNVSGAPK